MVGFELEVLAKKYDRFGWSKDAGSAAHDRLLTDWMDALQDYPIEEIKAACRAAVLSKPDKMPNEGAILSEIMRERAKMVARHKANKRPAREPEEAPDLEARRKAAAEIMAKFRGG